MQIKIYDGDINGGKVLYVVRGLPGSGKSTLAEDLAKYENAVVFNTDDFFMMNGEYKFDIKKLEEGHRWNARGATIAMRAEMPVVVTDGTNTMAWEMKPYVQAGVENNYRIILVEPDTSWKMNVEELSRRTKHKVPIEHIQRMKDRWQSNLTLTDILNSVRPN